jgi:hypothetical protein
VVGKLMMVKVIVIVVLWGMTHLKQRILVYLCTPLKTSFILLSALNVVYRGA